MPEDYRSASCQPLIPGPLKWRCGHCWAQRPLTWSPGKAFGAGWVTDVSNSSSWTRRYMRRLRPICRSEHRRTSTTTWCSPGTAPPRGCACPMVTGSRQTRRPDDLRRHLGGLCDGSAVGQAGCDHVHLAEGAGRRGRARDDHSVSPRAVDRLESYTPTWPLAENLPADQRGKLIEGIFEVPRSTRPRCWRSKITFWRLIGRAQSAV